MERFRYIRSRYNTLLEKYRKEIEQSKPSSGTFSYILSLFKKYDNLTHAKLAGERVQWLTEFFSIFESIKAKPAEEQSFADNIPLVAALEQKREYLEQNPAPDLARFFNSCALWWFRKTMKGIKLKAGAKAFLQKDLAACEQFVSEKIEQYTDLEAKGILPRLIGEGKIKSSSPFNALKTMLNASKDYISKLAKGDQQDVNIPGDNNDELCLGKKLSLNTNNSFLLLRGLTAVRNYLASHAGFKLEYDQDRGFVGSMFIAHKGVGLSLSDKRPEPSACLASTADAPVLEANNLPVVPAEAAVPIIEKEADTNASKLTAKP